MEISEEKKTAIRALLALKELHLLHLKHLKDLRKLRRKPKCFVKPISLKRELVNLEDHLLKDLLWGDAGDFKNFSRMTITDFEELVLLATKVEPAIKKESSGTTYATSTRVRLAVTLRYIACGDSYRSIEFLSKISRKTICDFVPKVLETIYNALHKQHLALPSSVDGWIRISNHFQQIWDFPHTVGAMDGKHIAIKAPEQSGSECYDDKGFSTIALLAIVDANRKFIHIDVSGNGRASDNLVFKSSDIYDALKAGKLNLPPQEKLPASNANVPYFLIVDDIFELDRHLMKAYNRNIALNRKQKVFNNRISRARMSVDMAFGRLSARFRIFHRPIEVELKHADLVVKTCCVLHNYLSKPVTRPASTYTQRDLVNLPATFTPLGVQENQHCYKYAYRIRADLANYLLNESDAAD